MGRIVMIVRRESVPFRFEALMTYPWLLEEALNMRSAMDLIIGNPGHADPSFMDSVLGCLLLGPVFLAFITLCPWWLVVSVTILVLIVRANRARRQELKRLLDYVLITPEGQVFKKLVKERADLLKAGKKTAAQALEPGMRLLWTKALEGSLMRERLMEALE